MIPADNSIVNFSIKIPARRMRRALFLIASCRKITESGGARAYLALDAAGKSVKMYLYI